MEQGTLGELYLTRSVTKHIRKHNKNLLQGAGVGNDFSALRLESEYVINAEGVGTCPYVAWVKAMNNLAVSGGNPEMVRINMMLPVDIEEAQIKSYMGEFNELADCTGVQIAGGNTSVSPIYARPSFVVHVLGQCRDSRLFSRKKCSGCQIVMTGYTGLMGTDLIARKNLDELSGRFAVSYIRSAFFDRAAYDIQPHVKAAMDCLNDRGVADNMDIAYMHDVSFGGVYGALWQLGARLNAGVDIEHFSIPIKQETVEICEFYNINPYMLEGTGSLLIVTDQADELVKSLELADINARVIGRVTESKDRIVSIGNDEKRFLAPVKGDEIYKVMSTY